MRNVFILHHHIVSEGEDWFWALRTEELAEAQKMLIAEQYYDEHAEGRRVNGSAPMSVLQAADDWWRFTREAEYLEISVVPYVPCAAQLGL